jgi:hypothetical protein
MTKCPYVPPHEWNVDFPHLMLRAKAIKFKKRRCQPAQQDAVVYRYRRQIGRYPGGGSNRQYG